MLTFFQDPDIPAQAGQEVGGTTQVHPIGLAALVLVIGIGFLAKKRYAGLPIILLLCFIPAAQRVVIASVDFTFIRVALAACWARLILRGELRPLLWNHLDRFMVLWAGASIVFGTLNGMTLTMFINRVGTAGDAMMTYFLFRQLIRDPDDLVRLAMLFVICSFGVAVSFIIESRTQQNMFHIFGGVPQFTDIRNGRLRCQGAFAHSILAGCFWACLVPFYFVRGWLGRGWLLPLCGVASALLIVVLSSSSTPIMAVLFGIMGGAAILVRGALRWWRWLIVAWLAVLHFVLMNMPVWHLLARVDIVSGSTGWHRYHLVDKFFEHFSEWWLVGTLTTGQWGPGLHDVTNQYVVEGVAGGIWRLTLFCACIVTGFMGVSRSLRMPGSPKSFRLTAWALGTAMFMHCMNFIGVSYFEQIVVEWHMTLAAVASLTLVPGVSASRQMIECSVRHAESPMA
ncbi:MAG: hypothetical protein KDC98_09285 [Planctomycetes bacterium]|nr:hypothetical protein [Planctomycetota bacterium]